MDKIIFFLSKLIPLLLTPLNLFIYGLLIYLVKKKKWIIKLNIFMIFFFSNGFLSEGLWRIAEYPWQRIPEMNSKKADVIVVLSSKITVPPGDSNLTEFEDPDRLLSGIKLYKEGKANKIIFTGGYDPFKSEKVQESIFYTKFAIDRGIPRDNIFSTRKIKNTNEESKAIKDLLDGKNTYDEKILLVTSAYHMTRAKKLFERQGLFIIPFPVDFKSTNNWNIKSLTDPRKWIPNPKYLHENSIIFREFLGRLVYGVF